MIIFPYQIDVALLSKYYAIILLLYAGMFGIRKLVKFINRS